MATSAENAPGQSPRGVWLIMSGVLLALLLASLDATVVATALPEVIGALGGFDRYAWVFTAYTLAQTVTTPIAGKLSDLYGRKIVFIAGIVIFLVGSVLCGATTTMNGLILFRGLQGVGGGAIVVIAMVIIGDLFPPRERGKVQGLTGAILGLSSIVGPALGGWITGGFGWRWIFFINLPIGAVTLLVLAFLMPPLRQPGNDSRVDWLGAALLVAATVPLLLAFTWAGGTYPWGSAQVVGCLLAAAVILVGFVWYELRAPQPIVDPRLFGNGVVAICAALAALVSAGLFGATQYLPLFLQGVIGVSAAGSGAILTPLMLGAIVGSILSGVLVSRSGRYRWVALVGQVLSVAGMLLLVRLSVASGTAAVSLAMVVLGLGLGFGLSLYTTIVQTAAPRAMLGQATSALTFFRSLGGTIAVAVMGSILAQRYTDAFAANLTPALRDATPAALAHQLGRDPQSVTSPAAREALRIAFASVPGGDALLAQLTEAIRASLALALHGVFVACLIVTLLALVLTFFLREIPLHAERPRDERAPTEPMEMSAAATPR